MVEPYEKAWVGGLILAYLIVVGIKLWSKLYTPHLHSKRRFFIDFVYIIKCGSFPYYKIGISWNVEKRLKELQPSCPISLTLTFSIRKSNARFLEKDIHNDLKYKMLHPVSTEIPSEWFELTDNELSILIKKIIDS